MTCMDARVQCMHVRSVCLRVGKHEQQTIY